jgi:hypothetical protein
LHKLSSKVMRSCLTPQHCRRPKGKPWIEYQIVDHAYCDGVISISMASFIDTSHVLVGRCHLMRQLTTLWVRGLYFRAQYTSVCFQLSSYGAGWRWRRVCFCATAWHPIKMVNQLKQCHWYVSAMLFQHITDRAYESLLLSKANYEASHLKCTDSKPEYNMVETIFSLLSVIQRTSFIMCLPAGSAFQLR